MTVQVNQLLGPTTDIKFGDASKIATSSELLPRRDPSDVGKFKNGFTEKNIELPFETTPAPLEKGFNREIMWNAIAFGFIGFTAILIFVVVCLWRLFPNTKPQDRKTEYAPQDPNMNPNGEIPA